MACTPRTTAPPTNPQATPASPASQSAPTLPQATTIQIEGDRQQVPLEPLQTPNFSTNFPSDRFVFQRGGGSGEGEGTWFYWKQPDGTIDKNAYVQVFFPGTNQTVAQVRQFLVGERGIFKANGWQKVDRGSGDSYAESAYSAWLRDLILFKPRTNPQNIAGTAYIGEIDGRAFYAVSLYPREYADGFTPRADVILKNLRGKATGLSNKAQLAPKRK